jgi:hypothetical protein
MRYVVAGGSILMIMAAFFVYFNFGNSETSKAKNVASEFVITYHTTDLTVPGLLLVDDASTARTAFNDYKTTPGSTKRIKSDQDSVRVVIKLTKSNQE